MKNGCATSVRKENGALVIPGTHPAERYCIRLAALSNTTIELPPGARLQTASSAMLRYLKIESANTVERDIILMTSMCVPPPRDEAGAIARNAEGQLMPAPVHEFITEQSMPYCPRPTAEITVVLSTGVVQFLAYLNANSHDARVVMEESAPPFVPAGIPVRPGYAQDLYATADADEVIPWVPDDAWADGTRTVVVWHRPMPTLPAMLLGPDGEQRATPAVMNANGSVALVYHDRVTRFRLRLDDRVLAFSDQPPAVPLLSRPGGFIP
jgi:hypothetical protein